MAKFASNKLKFPLRTDCLILIYPLILLCFWKNIELTTPETNAKIFISCVSIQRLDPTQSASKKCSLLWPFRVILWIIRRYITWTTVANECESQVNLSYIDRLSMNLVQKRVLPLNWDALQTLVWGYHRK